MLKSELLEKLKDIADDADINEAIQGIEGLAKPFDVTSIGLEDFKKVLESNKEVKAYYQSALDSGIGKGVATFKSETLPKIIEEELKKANNKKKTPEQLELEELKAKIAKMEAERLQAELIKNNAAKLKDKGLDEGFAKYIKEDSDIEFFENTINAMVDSKVKEKLGSSSYKPPESGVTQIEKWTLEQAMAYMNQHPEADINLIMSKVK